MSFLVSVILTGAAAAAPPPNVDIAAVNAIEFCADASHAEQIAIPAEYKVHLTVDAALAASAASQSVPELAVVPPLVQRFAARSNAVRLNFSADFVEVPASNGSVWIILGRGGLKACEVMLTGVEKIAEIQDSVFSGFSRNPKWTMLYSTQGVPKAPIRYGMFSQSVPVKDKPNFGVRLKITALREEFANPEGVQLEADLVAGNLKITPTGITISQ